MERLFREASELAKDAAPGPNDPPVSRDWLRTLREVRHGSDEWEDTLFAVADYFGHSTDK
jgi:hypothetical protein